MFKTVDQLGTALTRTTLRHTVLSNNLANSNTPGFKRSDVQTRRGSFSRELGVRMKRYSPARTHPKHLSHSRRRYRDYSVVQDHTTTMRNDGNNVDPEREMSYIMENQLHYQALADAVSRKLGQLRSAIGEGRR